MTTNTDNEQTELKMKLTITADELFALHPLPWTHHLLLIKDANGRQVIHTGGLYDQQGRPYSGPYLSGINALLVEAVNSRVSASSAAPAGPEYDLDPLEFWCDLAEVLGHPRPAKADVPALVSEVKDRLATPAAPVVEKCEHGIPWSMECFSCGHSDYAAAASTASTQEDELVDEVQHRMDQVVEAAVEWHQAGREGGEWFDAAEKLGAAINSLLELRDEPGKMSGLTPELTKQQQAYNQGIEDAKCAIRAESQGGGYWAAAYINAIARRCSPFRYTGMPTGMDEPTREQALQAITDIQEARESHVQWAAHLQDSTREDCQGCADHAAHIGDADYHDDWIAKYDNVIAVLTRVPFAAPSSQPAIDAAAREIARQINGGDRTDGLYPPTLAELLEDCSIVNEEKLAQWLESIISRYFPEP